MASLKYKNASFFITSAATCEACSTDIPISIASLNAPPALNHPSIGRLIKAPPAPATNCLNKTGIAVLANALDNPKVTP